MLNCSHSDHLIDAINLRSMILRELAPMLTSMSSACSAISEHRGAERASDRGATEDAAIAVKGRRADKAALDRQVVLDVPKKVTLSDPAERRYRGALLPPRFRALNGRGR